MAVQDVTRLQLEAREREKQRTGRRAQHMQRLQQVAQLHKSGKEKRIIPEQRGLDSNFAPILGALSVSGVSPQQIGQAFQAAQGSSSGGGGSIQGAGYGHVPGTGGRRLRRIVMNSGLSGFTALYGPNVPGHAGHMHLEAPADQRRALVKFGRKLQRLGFRVGEHGKFGGVAPVHKGKAHYENRALDINYGPGGSPPSEQRKLTRLLRLLQILSRRS